MGKLLRFVLVLLVLAIVLAITLDSWLQREYVKPGPSVVATRIGVAPGASVRSVLAQLSSQGVLDAPMAVEIHLRSRGRHPQIKAGTYDIPPGASAAQIVRLLEEGNVVLEQLTVVEGSTYAELRRALERHPSVSSTLRGKSDADVMIAIGHAGMPPEGRFFPDTYRFAAKTSDVDILKLAFAKMQTLLDEAWRQKRESLPVRTPDEALILASIVEKETGLGSERARIAGVFTTRLRMGMRLQSDPTVIYGLGAKYDGDIRTRDLSADTPFNTYTRAGLPPTPISLPGRDSVLAVVKPMETGAIYFVATGDGSGAHYFSKTLEEHNEAVKRYLARLRSRSNAAPRTRPPGES